MPLRDEHGELVSVQFVIEHLIDNGGLSELLYAIANVCAAKAEHRGDKNWKYASTRIAAAARREDVREVSQRAT